MAYPDDESQAIDLREFLAVLRRRKWSVIIPTLLVVAAALMFVYLRIPLYTSTATVQVLPKTVQEALAVGTGTSFANMEDEAKLVTSARIEARAADLLDVAGFDASLATDADVSVSVPANTSFMDIDCTTEDAASAQACAQAFADAYVAERKAVVDASIAVLRGPIEVRKQNLISTKATLEATIAATTNPVDRATLQGQLNTLIGTLANVQQSLDQLPRASDAPAEVVTPADLPTEPSNKDYVTVGILAAFVGLALGIGFAFLRQRTDQRVGEHEGLDVALGTPVLAVVPHVKKGRKDPGWGVVSLADPESPAAEAYRSARPALLHRAREHDVKTILITGPGQGEGKSTTTANLGVVLAHSGHRVVMVSCDLRKPSLYRLFLQASQPGLTEVLQDQIALRNALVQTAVPNLVLLTTGVPPANPSELLGSGAMAAVIAELRANADFVLLDTPPSLVVADALEIAPMVDGILAVVDGSTTTHAEVMHLRAQLDQVGGRLLGCILNNLDPQKVSRYGSYFSASYRYAGTDADGSRRRRDRDRPDRGYPATFPRGASEVDVALGSGPFAEVSESDSKIPSGNGNASPNVPARENLTMPDEDGQDSLQEPTLEPDPAPLPDPPDDAGMWR